jgi:hypothetical protein
LSRFAMNARRVIDQRTVIAEMAFRVHIADLRI